MTSQQLQSEMDRLQEVAVALEARTEDLNGLIEQLAYRLDEAGVSVTAWIDSGVMPGWKFGYAKVGDEWTLAARKSRGGPLPLTNAPRKLRLAAMGRIGELIRILADKSQKFLADVEQAAKITERSIEEV